MTPVVPELPPLTALTRSEGELVDRYLEMLAAQALVGRAPALREALTVMHARGETEVHTGTLGRALRVLDGERRASLVAVPPPPDR